mmetsp:Transcript_15100/g.34809  ORF Transcript_15100/g.34809 Transcript_15100/m.34809 type:complete len:95 (-) Transcript_15100:430-714(-)
MNLKMLKNTLLLIWKTKEMKTKEMKMKLIMLVSDADDDDTGAENRAVRAQWLSLAASRNDGKKTRESTGTSRYWLRMLEEPPPPAKSIVACSCC